ncbi:MAG: molybdenum-binding protein [Candidatus Altiarchaeales archaeon]|nr:MAG: molybdenum-binding protein [Candidatus Altiarchaeales archaeon]
MKVRTKIWVERDNKPLFGDGKIALLDAIERFGSIKKTAREFGMSYLHAQKKIKTLEKRLDIKLIETTIGGKGGGGSHLTEEGKRLVRDYKRFREGIESMVQKRFNEVFNVRF